MNKIIIVLLFIYFSVGYGQNDNFLIGSGINDFSSITNYTSGAWNKTRNNSSNEKVQGSPYLFEDWETVAIITTQEDKKYKIRKLNYDTKLDLFVAKISQDSVFSFKPTYLKSVVINNRQFKKYLNQKSSLFDYYEVISEGKNVQLLKRDIKVIRQGIINHLTMEKETDYYILRTKYYVNDHGKIKELLLKKKKILQIFGDQSQNMKKYLSENNLSIKKENDLKKIFNFYDSLEKNL